MDKTTTPPYHKGQAKNSKRLNQKQLFYSFLQKRIATTSKQPKKSIPIKVYDLFCGSEVLVLPTPSQDKIIVL